MEPFKSKNKCKIIVLVEMVLSGLTLGLFILFLIGMILHLAQDSSILDLLEEGTQPAEEIIIFVLRMVVLTHLVVLVLVLVAGSNVLSRACSLPSNVSDWELLDSGCRSCKLFCRLEVFRMILIVITFLGELSLFNLSIYLEMTRNVFNLPVIFGWFFTSELQKELESRRKEVINPNNCLYTLTNNFSENCPRTHCQSIMHTQNYIESNSEHLGMFMNTTPAVAYFLSSSTNVAR